MDFKSRSEKLLAMRRGIRSDLAQKLAHSNQSTSTLINASAALSTNLELPNAALFAELEGYSQDLNDSISKVYSSASSTLSGINLIKNKKDSIEKLIDVSTCILQIKRLSYGLGESHQEVYRSIKSFYEIKDKAVYCTKYVRQIEEEISKIRDRYKQDFTSQLKTSNSENLHQYSRILALIPEPEAKQSSNSLQKLLSLYTQTLKKDYLPIEDELLNILIVAPVIDKDYNYIFFELVNKAFKLFVNNLKVFRNNAHKLYSDEGVHTLIVHLVQQALNPLLSQIIKRIRKYFELDKIPVTASKAPMLKDKDVLRIEHFCSEYRSICNQVQRFATYLKQQGPNKTYSKLTYFAHEIMQILTTESMIEMNDTLIKYSQANLRHKLNNLIKKSPFITSLWHLDSEFLKSLGSGNLADVPSMHEFIDEMFLIFEKGISETFQTLNMLIISTVINYLTNQLIHDDGFYVFNEIFKKYCLKLALQPGGPQTAVILVLNSLHSLHPNFKHLVESIKVPAELDRQKIMVQLNELHIANSNKARKLIMNFIQEICKLNYIKQQLENPNAYKQVLQGWNKLHKDVFQILVETLAETHAQYIKENMFLRKFDSLSALAFQRQIRGIVTYYEGVSGASVLNKFKTLFLYCSVLLLDSEENLQKFLKEVPEALNDHAKIRQVFQLRRREY